MSHAAANPIPYEKTRIPNGRLGMWWFLGSEIVTFGGAVTAFLMCRMFRPEWFEESAKASLSIGLTNTVVLLTSSFTVVLAHQFANRGDRGKAVLWVWMTILLCGVFLGIKAYEWSHKFHEGLVPAKSVFWAFYYCMTGLHALHMVAGVVIMLYVIGTMKRDGYEQRVEVAGMYWHFVDVVWIFLFPLLYVAN